MSDLAAANCGCGCEDRCDRCENNSLFGLGGNNCSSIIWIILLLSCCGCGNNGSSWNWGGSNNSCWWIILLLFFCGGCGNDNGCC